MPLYKNPLVLQTLGARNLKRKSRAPDLVFSMVTGRGRDGEGKTDGRASPTALLVVVEVAVASHPSRVREEKISKYEDLATLSSQIDLAGGVAQQQCRIFTIIVDANGNVPDETKADVEGLTQLTSSRASTMQDIQAETERFCSHLQTLVCPKGEAAQEESNV